MKAKTALPTWKRAIDIACCLCAAPFFALLTLVVAIVMRFVSPGPIFFRQDRVGLDGRLFRLFKFRSMHVAADTQGHQKHFAQLVQTNTPMQKLDSRGDSRMIPGAWLLRSSGLDELPQIVNVWRGEMSIVGPRPCIPYECERFSPEQRKRFDAVPGLTGLWQVSGKNRTTFQEMIRLDCEYAERKSFLLDLSIIARTVPALCTQIGDVMRSRRQAAPAKPALSPSTTRPATAVTQVS